jgi:uncharacterized protein (TIGR03066 family)
MYSLVTLAALYSGTWAAADDKLDEKFLVGKWTIKYVTTAKTEDAVKKSIEFKDDGTFNWDLGVAKKEGTYKLNGTTLELKLKGVKSTTLWKDLSIKDGKLIHPIGKNHNELTREK